MSGSIEGAMREALNVLTSITTPNMTVPASQIFFSARAALPRGLTRHQAVDLSDISLVATSRRGIGPARRRACRRRPQGEPSNRKERASSL